jgi:hypothetical protein
MVIEGKGIKAKCDEDAMVNSNLALYGDAGCPYETPM